MKDGPAFQLYAADFYMDTLGWDCDDIGAYFRLLMAEWVNGSLPVDLKQLAKIAQKTPKKFTKNWKIFNKKFHTNGSGNLINDRLEKEREKQRKYKESQAEAGKRGAKKRWEQDGDPIGDPIGDPNSESMALQSSSSSSSYINKEVGYALPSQEEINEASLKKITTDLDKITEELYQSKIFKEAPAFKNTMLKKKVNPRSILHTFIRCYLKREFKNKDDPWAYCTKIIATENGNYNEREYGKTTI